MAAIEKDLDDLEVGATYSLGWTYYHPLLDDDGNVVYDTDGTTPLPGDPVDLTGCSASMQVRAKKTSTEPLITATSDAVGTGLPGAGRIFIQPLDADSAPVIGRIEVELTDQDTMTLQPLKTPAAYDLELTWPIAVGQLRARVDRLLEGAIPIDTNVTRIEELNG